jgi:hypothetical protein
VPSDSVSILGLKTPLAPASNAWPMMAGPWSGLRSGAGTFDQVTSTARSEVWRG